MHTPGPALVSCINGKAVLQTQLHLLCSCPGKLLCHRACAHRIPGKVVTPEVAVVINLQDILSPALAQHWLITQAGSKVVCR